MHFHSSKNDPVVQVEKEVQHLYIASSENTTLLLIIYINVQ